MTDKNSRAEQACELFKSGFSCSQAVLAAFAPGLGLDKELALKIAQPFGGGLAHRGGLCGAAAGAVLVIGLKYGRIYPDDTAAKERTYTLVNQFLDEFAQAHGNLDCPDLLGYDLAVQEEMDKAEAEGLFDSLCPSLVRSAAAFLENIL